MFIAWGLVIWRWFGVACVSLALGAGCTTSTLPPVSCPLPFIPKADLPQRGISAHRGGLLGCPGNTLGAFQRAICRGAHQIELDVRATVDHVIVVAHDDQVTGRNHTIHISESTLKDVQSLPLGSCTGETVQQAIPTLEEALAIMPENIWINVDIKDNDPEVAKLVAESILNAHRFDQVIFAARNKAVPEIREVAEKAGQKSWIANMSREFSRGLYVDATINSCADFIQLIKIPYVPFVRGKPNQGTMNRLKNAGVRVNFSWLREDEEGELQRELQDLFDRRIDFVLVDHVEPAMKAADALGVPPLVPRWTHASASPTNSPFHCPSPF